MTPGLRERKKRRTRETIVREALRLFEERGYDHVTVADIAAAADIAPRTFFSYFPTKEDVVFADFPDDVAALVRHLDGRAPGTTTVDAMRAWIAELVTDHDLQDPELRRRHKVLCSSPSLEAVRAAKMTEVERLLRDGVAADLGAQPGDLRPRMVAAAAVGALSALESLADEDPDLTTDPMALVDEAIVFLRGGIAALQDHPTPTPATD